MGRHRSKEKRIKQVSEAALQSEIQRNAEKIPDILPDSALFEEDNAAPKKAKKILLHPRPVETPKQKTVDEEIEDIWNSNKDLPKSIAPSGPKPKTKKSYPSSSMAYNSAKVVKPRPQKVEEEVHEVAINEAYDDGDTGLGDTLEGDVPNVPEVKSVPPTKPKEVKNEEVVLDAKITKRMPDEMKKEKYRALREGRKQIIEKHEQERIPELEKAKEYNEEIVKRNEEIAARPKKEKEDKLLRFIADEPDFQVYEPVTNLAEAPADNRPFVRLQRQFEVERRVGLHEPKI